MSEGSMPALVRSVTSPSLRIAAMGLVLVMLSVAFPAAAADAPATVWGDEAEVAIETHLSEFDVAAYGKDAFVVWRHSGTSESDIYGRAYDGTSWAAPIRLETQPYLMGQGSPSVAIDGSGTHVVWEDAGDGDVDVYYRHFDGTAWWPEVEVSHDAVTEQQGAPDVAVDGGKVHVVYMGRPGTDNDIFYRSLDGDVWGSEAELSSDAGTEWQLWPAVAASGGRVHAVWEERSTSGSDVYYRCFDGNGWLPEVKMNDQPFSANSPAPKVAATGDRVIVAWMVDGFGAYYRMQNGTAWGPATPVPPPPGAGLATWPAVSADAGRIFVISTVEVGGAYDLYMMQDDGAGWSAPEAVSQSGVAGHDVPSSLVVSGGRAHVAWARTRTGYEGIWYRGGVMDAASPASMAGHLPEWVTGSALSVPWTATDDYGLAMVTLLVSKAGSNGLFMRWTEIASMPAEGASDSGTFHLADVADGYYQFATVAKDLFGHVEAKPDAFDAEVACDSTPPEGSISIEAGAVYTNRTAVSIDVDWSETMLGLGAMIPEVSPIEARFSNDGVWDTETWSHLSTVSPAVWTLAGGDGPKTVWCQLRNPAGLVSATLADDIILDWTAPSASVVIDFGHQRTLGTFVMLTLASVDTLSGVDAVRYSNDGIWDTEAWEAPAVTKEWYLTTGDGPKKVQYQVRDRAGNVALTDAYTLLDQTAPSVVGVSPTGDAKGVEVGAQVVITFSESMDRATTEAALKVTRGTTLVGGSCNWSLDGRTLTFTPAGDLDEGASYEVTIGNGASDVAGNGLPTAMTTSFDTEGKAEGSGNGKESNAMPLVGLIIAVLALVIAVVAFMRKAK